MPENYSGYELAESLRSLGVEIKGQKTELPTDQEILSLLEKSGDSLIHLYQAKLKEGGSDATLQSYLSPERQLEIVRALVTDIPQMIEWRNKIEQEEQEKKKGESKEKIDVSRAQWATVATTPPVVLEFDSEEEARGIKENLENLNIKHDVVTTPDGVQVQVSGCRISFAFWKKMCSYKEESKGGCRFCGLSQKNKQVGEVTTEQQLDSLKDALQRTAKMGNNRTVLEILPDGSFLNNFEVPLATQTGMMDVASQESSIFKVAIETRPEHCSASRVKDLLAHLRPEQQLNIYFGLETTDDFISAVIHRKGYGFKYFKDAVTRMWKGLDPEDKKRLHLSVYNIIKPAYLTEQEAIEMSVKMAEDINRFSQELGAPIDIKYEPSVITKGTAQEYLYKNVDETSGERRFKPLSYFSVAELIACLAEKNLHKSAKFGQRDDIDEFSTVPMVFQPDNEAMFSQFDFMVYNAVQRFNTTKDLRSLMVDLKIVMENSEEFRRWEKEFCGSKGLSALSQLLKKTFSKESGGKSLIKAEEEVVNFQKKVFIICDQIEYNSAFSEGLKTKGRAVEQNIKQNITDLFDSAGIDVFEIKKFILVDVGNEKDARMDQVGTNPDFYTYSNQAAFQVEIIILNEKGQPQSVWVRIPLVSVELPSRPDYIYT